MRTSQSRGQVRPGGARSASPSSSTIPFRSLHRHCPPSPCSPKGVRLFLSSSISAQRACHVTLSCVLNPEIIAERVDERATRLQAAPLHKAANQGTQIAEGGHVVKKKNRQLRSNDRSSLARASRGACYDHRFVTQNEQKN